MIYEGNEDAEVKCSYLHLKAEKSLTQISLFLRGLKPIAKSSSSEAIRARTCSVYAHPEVLRLLAGHLEAATTLTHKLIHSAGKTPSSNSK